MEDLIAVKALQWNCRFGPESEIYFPRIADKWNSGDDAWRS